MVQTDEERRAYQKEYNARPDVKARKKIKKKEYDSKPERKEYEKAIRDRPERKERAKRLRNKPEQKARAKAIRDRPENKIQKKEYDSKPERVEYSRKYTSNPKRKKTVLELNRILKLEVFSTYSKLHSNSNIPCCRCCGENTDLDFLTIDHIEGRKKLSSKEKNLKGKTLYHLLKKNNFPEDFQILCWNCNSAKGMKRNNNICPHERMRKEETFAMMEEQSSFEV